MTFAEKVKNLRKASGLTQDAMARKLEITTRTLQKYEAGDCYPKTSSILMNMAEKFNVDLSYFMDDKDEFIVEAGEQYGSKGQRQARLLVEQAGALFAGGELAEEDQEAFFKSIADIYFDSKRRAKKYTPKKYLKDEFVE